jgi:hypothetical protein
MVRKHNFQLFKKKPEIANYFLKIKLVVQFFLK